MVRDLDRRVAELDKEFAKWTRNEEPASMFSMAISPALAAILSPTVLLPT
jgi:hypothetical protein